MKLPIAQLISRSTITILGALLVSSLAVSAFPVITNVVETGGVNEPTDTVTAKWTGVTFTNGVANEPIPGKGANDPYTVGLFGNYAPCFVDRNHRWTNAATVLMPPYLAGQEYIMIGNDNRDRPAFRLDVFIAVESDVYLLIDNRLGDGVNTTPPDFTTNMTWVIAEGWIPTTNGINRTASTSTPDEIAVDEGANGTIDQYSSVYYKRFPAGTFQLKQPDNIGRNMYGVVVAAPPLPPSNLMAAGGDGRVTLTWTAASAAGYVVKRSPVAGGPYDILATNTTTTYIDLDVFNDDTYYYVVSAFNGAGESPDSNEAVATPKAAPANVAAIGGVGQVLVSWDAFPNAATYTVSRSTTSGGPYTVVASGVAGTSHLDTTVAAGRNYYYVVIAQLIGGGDSGQSLQAAALTAPSAPTLTPSLWAATAIRLAWVLNNQVVSGYSIEQSTDGVIFAPLAAVPATPRNYVDANLLPSTTYYYRVRAENASGMSDYSNIASTTTPSFGLNVNFANALTGTPANNPAPTPPGYAQDIGEPYGPRTNGLTYGWTGTNGLGIDIGVDSRWRMNANSPDLRWDTFNHLQKPQVLPTAVWELDIPVGFYHVYIVSGDPTATDSVFQFDLEGLVTESYVPVTGAWWREFNAQLPVEDGRLTVKSGPIAANHKINFIDIYPATPVAPTITAEPQSVTTQEFHPVSISVGSAGSFRRVHQWYHDGAPVPDGTNATLAFPAPQLSDSGQYTVIITNWGGSVTSIVANLTVEPDNEPPFIVSVGSLDGRTIGVCFSELLETNEFAPTTDPFSYFINDSSDIRVTAVTLRPDNKSVSLQLESVSGTGLPMSGQFYVTAVSIRDLKGNGETLSTAGTNTVFGNATNLGIPPANGSHYTCNNTTIELVGTGTDIWGNADQGYWAFRPVSGDFDARVRLDSLSLPTTVGPALTAKGGLIVRATTAGGSPTLHLLANPLPPGRNLAEAGRRTAVDGTTASWGTNQTALAMPQWLRLVRSGNTFTGYRSPNGVDWVLFASTTQTLPAGLELGLAVTSHTNSATHFTTGQFSNFSVSQPLADLGITMTDSPDPQVVGGNVTYSIGVNNTGPDTAGVVTVTDTLPASVTFVSASASQGACTQSAGTVTCNLGTLSSGASATITIVVTAPAAGTLNNTARVSSAAVDANAENNSASASTGVATRPTVSMPHFGAGSGFLASFNTEVGFNYIVEYNDDLSNPAGWTFLSSVQGDGGAKPISDPGAPFTQRFYRIRIE